MRLKSIKKILNIFAFVAFCGLDFGVSMQNHTKQNPKQNLAQNPAQKFNQNPKQNPKNKPNYNLFWHANQKYQSRPNQANSKSNATHIATKNQKSPNAQKSQNPQNMQAFIVKCERCIIHISFDEVEIARLKREFGEEGFYEVVDDMNYYNAELWDYARENGVEILSIDPSEYGFVAFDDMRLNTNENKRTHWMYLKNKFPQKIEYLATPHNEISIYFNLKNP